MVFEIAPKKYKKQ